MTIFRVFRKAWVRVASACAAPMLLGLVWAVFGGAGAGQGEFQEHMAAQNPLSRHVSGTAFAIGSNMVVTNAHVTMRCRAAGLPLMVGGAHGWQVRSESADDELALLVGPGDAGMRPLALSALPQLSHGSPVMLAGYPLQDGSFDRLQTTPGMVDHAALTVHQPAAGTSVSFVAADRDGNRVDPDWQDGLAYFGTDSADKLRWIVEIDASAGHGSSGGPVLDANGSVVGVVFAGNAGTGKASAVTLDDLRGFLLQAGITPDFAPPADQISPDWQNAMDRILRSVLRVGC